MGLLEETLGGKSLADYTNTQLRLALGAVLYTNTADMWKQYLNQQGYIGSVSDMLQRYYVDRNVPTQFRNYISAGIYINADTLDPNFASVSALLHLDGINGSTTFTDVTGKTWTPAGNAQIDTAQSKYGGASLLLDGVNSYASTTHGSDFDFGNEPFTIEFWYRPASISTFSTIISADGVDYPFGIYHGSSFASGIPTAAIGANGSSWFSAANSMSFGAVSNGVWYHFAIVREGDTFRCYKDGVQISTGTTDSAGQSVGNFGGLNVGKNATFYIGAHIDDLRITKGICRYRSGTTFTPPTSAFPDA